MRPATALLALWVFVLVEPSVASADPITLRVATIAPEGTAWAREFAAWGRDVELGTHGAVRIKLYYGSIAGDELTVLERIKREQLDGAFASESCVRLGPSLRVTRTFGLFQSREEASFVVGRLEEKVGAEFLAAGFSHMGDVVLGPEFLFTREPVRSMDELRKTRLFVWDLDDALRMQSPALGLSIVPLPLGEAARAYDDHRVDGFVSMASAALAFQWSAQARYLENLGVSYRNACGFFASRSFDALPIDAQRYIRAAMAKLRARLDDVSRRQDDALTGGLFGRQGLRTMPVSDSFRLDFYRAAREMRERVADKLGSPKLLEQVLAWLADYRVEHPVAK